MPSLWSLFHTPTVELLGWTLLHFVWQGALVAAVLAGVLYLLRDHTPRVRYVVSCAALFGLLALPVGTGVFLGGSGASSALSLEGAAVTSSEAVPIADVPRAAVADPAAAGLPSWRARVAAWVQPALPWVVLAWGLGVLGFALRLGGGAWRVRRVRRSSSPAPSGWRERLQALADRMGVAGSVGLRQSDRVDGPVLAGWWRPVILVPAGFLSGLPPAQVEALLLHELAHVRRHDVLVGRLQAIVETLLFFHPATWWISAQVRQAREACCDDLVVQAGSGRTTYAQALTALAERAVEGTATTAWAPAASDGSLLDRIRRLVAPPEAPATAGRRLSIVAAALLMVVVPVGLAACASQQSATDAESPSAAAAPAEAADAPEATDAPPEEAERRVVVIRGDSAHHTIRLEGGGPVEVEGLDEDVYVLRYGDRVDTIDAPGLDGLKRVPHPPFPPNGMGPNVRPPFNPDSLERVLLSRINPDSIAHAVQLRFDRDSLEQHVRRMQHRADSIAQRVAERWHGVPDSAFVARFDDFPPGDGEPPLNVDSLHIHLQAMQDSLRPRLEAMRESLRPRLEAMEDSLQPRLEEMEKSLRPRLEMMRDSLRPHLEAMRDSLRPRLRAMREQWGHDMPEHLRDEARRLREQARELEERAEEMERRREEGESGSSG